MRVAFGLLCVLGCAILARLSIPAEASAQASCSLSNIVVSSITTNGSITKIEWVNGASGDATEVGLMLLTDGSVWRTVDGGWKFVSMQPLLNFDVVRGIEQTADGSRIFLLTKGAWMWISEDAGATFTNSTAIGFYLHNLKPHPTIAEYVLAAGMSPCCQQSLACTTCEVVLRSSADGGISWKTIDSYLFYRGEKSYAWVSVGSASNLRSIAYVRYVDQEGDQRLKLGEPMNLVLLRDFEDARSVAVEVPNGGPFMVDGSTIIMARVTTGRAGLSTLMISRDFGASWSMVSFPPISSFDSQREWLPTESGNPFLGVFNGPDYSDGNVFVSTGGTGFFTVALRSLVSRFGKAHWTHLGTSMPGTYIANVHTDALKLKTKTMITYNHGAHWHELKLKEERKRLPAEPSDDDDVHLAAPFQGPKFFAPANAPGLVIAAGQTGKYLNNWDGEAVFVSRDAGRSWKKTLQGNFVLFGPNGGSVLLASDQSGFSNALHFSLDFGRNWTQCAFTASETTRVKAISMRSNFDDHMAPIVIMDAVNADDGRFTIFTMNLTAMYGRTCVDSLDFENWFLKGYDGSSCALGAQRVFRQRKQGALCQKLKGQSRLVSTSPCECEETDFVCPFCYERTDDGEGDCDFMWDDCDTEKSFMPSAPANCSEEWEVPDHANIAPLPESLCFGGLSVSDFDSEISCPPKPIIDTAPPPVRTLQSDILVTVGAISLALCGIVIVGLYYFCRNLIQGPPKIDFAAWKSAQIPATENDVRRENIQHGLEYQSDIDASSSLELQQSSQFEHTFPSDMDPIVEDGDEDEYSALRI
jgi:hypothetical protein